MMAGLGTVSAPARRSFSMFAATITARACSIPTACSGSSSLGSPT
jgi:hypothetical protein